MEEETQKENIKDNLEEKNNLATGELENENSNEIKADKEEIKKSSISNVEDNYNYSSNKNDCKSTTIEKPDNMSEEVIEHTNSSKTDMHNYLKVNRKRNLKSSNSSKAITKQFSTYLERVEDYKRKKEEKLNEMKKSLEEIEKRKMKEKPDISKNSRNIVKTHEKSKTTFLERMKEEQKNAKERKEKLCEKINSEKQKKKEEIEKPLEFNIKPNKLDQKFKKTYDEMMRKDQELKNKLNTFIEKVNEYKMKECRFHPNINIDKNEKNEGNKKCKNRVKSCELIKRLYDDGIKNHNEKRENLKEKYKISFKPKINGNSNNLAKKWKQRTENKKEESTKKENNYNIKNNKKKPKKPINKKK